MSDNSQKGFSVDVERYNDADKKDIIRKIKAEIFDWLHIFSVVIVAVIFLFTFVFKIATIEGKSMQNTLFENEKVIISRFLYIPKRGDVVVISRNKDNSNSGNAIYGNLPIIKRVIATEGQTVDIDFEKGVVFVDGKMIDEPYVRTPTNLKYDIEFPVTVKENCIFVMGDNRNDSLDSRSSQIGDNGMIDTRYVLGHVLIRAFPFNKFGGLD